MSFAKHITSEEIEHMEQAVFPGEITVIDNRDKIFEDAISYLSSQDIIGFDTETKPCFLPHAPRHKMALLQLSGQSRAFLFRLHQLGVPQKLADLLSNKGVLKIGAAVRDDIRGLQEYNKFEPGGFVDLQKMTEDFGIEEKSVRKMSAIILKKRVSKSQQLSNWENFKLSPAQMKYAATDAWICCEMYNRLKRHKWFRIFS